MSNTPPRFSSFEDMVHWVIQELGALCPSRQRLLAWRENPHDEHLRDVGYHVQEARCPICQAELEGEVGEASCFTSR